jgi:hypothetical protein
LENGKLRSTKLGSLSSTKNYYTCEVTSLAKFLELTEEVHSAWGPHGPDSADPWYRGLSNAEFKLTPGWYRCGEELLEAVSESSIWDEFRRRSAPLLDRAKPTNHWEWYFLMQHYGLPTRLLDWSEVSLVGLYFAVGDWKGLGSQASLTDAVVWMLDPSYLNEWSTKQPSVLQYEHPLLSKSLSHKSELWPRWPIALMPVYNSPRLAAQRGMFTIHGSDPRPIESMLPENVDPRVYRIGIPAYSVVKIRESLRLAGITDVSIFPEIPFLCQDILRAWKFLGGPVRGRT